MVQALEVNFDCFSTEFGKSFDYLNYLCFTFPLTLAKQSGPLLLIWEWAVIGAYSVQYFLAFYSTLHSLIGKQCKYIQHCVRFIYIWLPIFFMDWVHKSFHRYCLSGICSHLTIWNFLDEILDRIQLETHQTNWR